jgi:hypothetical protein
VTKLIFSARFVIFFLLAVLDIRFVWVFPVVVIVVLFCAKVIVLFFFRRWFCRTGRAELVPAHSLTLAGGNSKMDLGTHTRATTLCETIRCTSSTISTKHFWEGHIVLFLQTTGWCLFCMLLTIERVLVSSFLRDSIIYLLLFIIIYYYYYLFILSGIFVRSTFLSLFFFYLFFSSLNLFLTR